ncbi:SMI1/KNR4 family protein [Seonamhaeicola marinus]|nr:SMI1/KNR4 family protein [Seonamhaeicola marinus]
MLENIIYRLKKQEIKVYSSGPNSAERIDNASKILEIQLPESFKNYLLIYGSLSVKSFELNGLINVSNDSEPVHANFVGLTKESQDKYGLIKTYIQLGDAGLGDQWVLCCNSKSKNYGKVFYWNPGISGENDMEKCADSFEEFIEKKLLKLIE